MRREPERMRGMMKRGSRVPKEPRFSGAGEEESHPLRRSFGSHRLMVRTSAFQAGNRGSTPRGSTKMPRKIKKENKEDPEAINWRAAEYQYVQKDVGWYLLVGLVALVLIILSLLWGNFFFAVFILIAAATIMFFAKRRPRVFNFKITDKGVAIGENIFYDYEHLDGFAVRERPEKLDEIILKRKSVLNPYVKVPIDSVLAGKAKNVLAGKLPAVEYEESLIEIVAEWFGF